MQITVEDYLSQTHIHMSPRHIAELKLLALQKLDSDLEFEFNQIDELVRMYYIPDRGFMRWEFSR